MRAADLLTGLRRQGDNFPPAALALLLAAVLLADGTVVVSRSVLAPLPPPPAAAALPPPATAPPAVAPATPPPAPAVPALAEQPPPSDPAPPAPPPPAPPAPVAPAAVAPAEAPREGQLRISVPALGVDTAALGLRTRDDGTLEVPRTARDVGWYADGAVPGDVGPAVFAGHIDLNGRAGVFSRLSAVQAGDAVEVVRPDGRLVTFVVTRVEQHAKDAFPTTAVYGPTDVPELRLITCGGSFDRARGSYRDNVVVFGELAG